MPSTTTPLFDDDLSDLDSYLSASGPARPSLVDSRPSREGSVSLTIQSVIRQRQFPVVIRERKGKILCQTPYAPDNREFLQRSNRKPVWNKQHKLWELPKAWFKDTVQDCAARWGKVYVVQPYNEMEKCAAACWNAVGIECECSCMGQRHGTGRPEGRWYEISETCAISWDGESYRISVVEKKSSTATQHSA